MAGYFSHPACAMYRYFSATARPPLRPKYLLPAPGRVIRGPVHAVTATFMLAASPPRCLSHDVVVWYCTQHQSDSALGMIISKMRPGEHTHTPTPPRSTELPDSKAPAPGFNPHPSHSQTLASYGLGLIGRWEKGSSHAMGPAQTHPHRRLRIDVRLRGLLVVRGLLQATAVRRSRAGVRIQCSLYSHASFATRPRRGQWSAVGHTVSPADSCVPRDTKIPGYLCLLHSDEMNAG